MNQIETEHMVLGYSFNEILRLRINIKSGVLEINIKIDNPNLHGPSMWQDFKECNRNIRAVYYNSNKSYVIVGVENKKLFFQYFNGNASNETSCNVSIPLSDCIGMIDTIIETLSSHAKKNN